MVEVRLYGSLRRFALNLEVTEESVAWVDVHSGDSVADTLRRLGIDPDREVGSIFVNGRYAYTTRDVVIREGDRLGVFPKNMSMLYC